jgi:hypothetical protein
VSPARLEVGIDPSSDAVLTDVQVRNLGQAVAIVQVELTDLLVSPDGAYQTPELGQTPASFGARVSLDRDQLALAPGESGVVKLRMDTRGLIAARSGSLLLRVLDTGPAETTSFGQVRVGTKLLPAVLVPLLAVPLAQDGQPEHIGGDLQLSVAGTGLRVGQARADGPLDGLLPLSVPGVVDHGPLSAAIGLRNTGDVFGHASSTVEFSTVNPLDWLPGRDLDERPFLQVDAPPVALMVGDGGEAWTTSELEQTGGRPSDTTPLAGLVRVRSTSVLTLVGSSSEATVQDTYVLVLPWKEGSAVGLVVLLWRLTGRILRRRGRLPRAAATPRGQAERRAHWRPRPLLG